MITYAGYKVKIIFYNFFYFLGYHVVAYAEMGRDREFCYPGTPGKQYYASDLFL